MKKIKKIIFNLRKKLFNYLLFITITFELIHIFNNNFLFEINSKHLLTILFILGLIIIQRK